MFLSSSSHTESPRMTTDLAACPSGCNLFGYKLPVSFPGWQVTRSLLSSDTESLVDNASKVRTLGSNPCCSTELWDHGHVANF